MIYNWSEAFSLGYCITSSRTLNSDNFIMIKFRVPWNDRQALHDFQELYKAGFSKMNLKLYKKTRNKSLPTHAGALVNLQSKYSLTATIPCYNLVVFSRATTQRIWLGASLHWNPNQKCMVALRYIQISEYTNKERKIKFPKCLGIPNLLFDL